MRLKDKVAIVTGGSQGIGQAICEAFGREGAKVAVVNHRNPERGEAVANEIGETGGTAKAFRCDVSNKADVNSLIKNVTSEFSTVDILVANAGIMINKQIEKYSEEEWDTTINVNLKGSFLTAQAVVPIMKKKNYGKIIFISSVHAERPYPPCLPYNAAKAGLNHMASSIAIELFQHRINVNVINPGWIDTPGERRDFTEEQIQREGQKLPWGRMGTSADIGRAAAFLASDDADYITGTTLRVDGGFVYKDVAPPA